MNTKRTESLITHIRELQRQGFLDEPAIDKLERMCEELSGQTRERMKNVMEDSQNVSTLAHDVFHSMKPDESRCLQCALESTSDPITSFELAERFYGIQEARPEHRKKVERLMRSLMMNETLQEMLDIDLVEESIFYRGELSHYNYKVTRKD